MNAIYGVPHNPHSRHILIIRGIDTESINYFHEHIKKYPKWGCIVVRGFKQVVYDDWKEEDHPIHKIITAHSFMYLDDKEVIEHFLKLFPKYSDEDDPPIEATYWVPPSLDVPSLMTVPIAHDSMSTHGKVYVASGKIPFPELRFSRSVDIKALTIRNLRSEILRSFLEDDSLWEQEEKEDFDGDLNVRVKFGTPVLSRK